MPAQQARVSISAALGNSLNAAVVAHAKDETKFGFQNLPAGIQNGLAKVQKAYFDVYKTGDNTGKHFFRMEAVVIKPTHVQTPEGLMKVEGLTTSVVIPICDTKIKTGPNAGQVKKAAEHISDVLNEFRKLGMTTGHVKSLKDVETLCLGVEKASPYTKFTTRAAAAKPGETPRVFEQWVGNQGIDAMTNGHASASGKTEDNSEQVDGDAGAAGTSEGDAGGTEGEGQVDVDQGDLDSLLALANANNKDARKQLNDMALSTGKTQEEIDALPDWDSVVAVIRGEGGEGEQAADEPAELITPTKGGTFGYRPVDTKTGQPAKTQIEVEATAVNTKNQTVDLQKIGDKKKVWKAVPWASLERAE